MGVGSVPLTVGVSSAMTAVAAATVGASLLPLMLMVTTVEDEPPWLSDTVTVKLSVRLSPAPRPCTAGREVFNV